MVGKYHKTEFDDAKMYAKKKTISILVYMHDPKLVEKIAKN